ncbi:hypothetical protein MTR_1g042830 [Medicago truncatula]|uniref:Uncharacterized protein n=1 Tax=Medicago truncatula TaxID=3880 RepID=G7I4N7_MEDTR|nr:hypothetical protein MTR_1g042830 [Medicago truncatula]
MDVWDDGVMQNKPKADWTDDDKKKIQYDLKVKHAHFHTHRKRQSKVTTIKESQNLKTLGITILVGKIKEHEHEILRLKAREEDIKKKEKNSIALKSSL